MIVSSFLFYYLGYGFDHFLNRLLYYNEYLLEFETEAYLLINIILSVWIIGASKEMFTLDEPHILLINKKKYINSKIIAYLLYYLFITVLLYGVYQLIVILLYGYLNFNYLFLFNLLLNVSAIHLIVVLVSGNNKNIFLTMIYITVFLIINMTLNIDFKYQEYIMFFLPLQPLSYPVYGYIHNVLLLVLVYLFSYSKHLLR